MRNEKKLKPCKPSNIGSIRAGIKCIDTKYSLPVNKQHKDSKKVLESMFATIAVGGEVHRYEI